MAYINILSQMVLYTRRDNRSSPETKNCERNDANMIESAKFPSIREAARRGPVSEYLLRLWLKQGKLPGVYSGKKFLVNYERLLEQLNVEAVTK